MPVKYHIVDRRRTALRSLGQSTLGTLFLPAYRAVFNLRRERFLSKRAGIPGAPIVTVGGTLLGGSGKTPVTCALYDAAAQAGKRGAIVLKHGNSSQRYIDELLLFAGRLAGSGRPRVTVSEDHVLVEANGSIICAHKRKLDGARMMAGRDGVDFVIVDDAQQLFSLQPALSICLLHPKDYSGRLFPQGMLREGLEATERADLVLARTGCEVSKPPVSKSYFCITAQGVAPLNELLNPWVDCEPAPAENSLYDVKRVSFAGIGWPEGFEESLEEMNLAPSAMARFSDHQVFNVRDLRLLEKMREKQGAEAFVTTEKDGCRLLPIILRALHGEGCDVGLPEELLAPVSHYIPDLVVAAQKIWDRGYYVKVDAQLPKEALDRFLEVIA
jgi:tetraacyldisaccharide 4'-kinase